MNNKLEIRPWGKFEILTCIDGYKIKRIEVNPGQRLSLQSHKHRDEHWIVISGVGQLDSSPTVIDMFLRRGDYAHIPKNSIHRIENTADEMLILIEVQIGDYLEEDDIIRYSDDYGRA